MQVQQEPSLSVEAIRIAVGACPIGYNAFHGRYNPTQDQAHRALISRHFTPFHAISRDFVNVYWQGMTVGEVGLCAGIKIGLTTVATPTGTLD